MRGTVTCYSTEPYVSRQGYASRALETQTESIGGAPIITGVSIFDGVRQNEISRKGAAWQSRMKSSSATSCKMR